VSSGHGISRTVVVTGSASGIGAAVCRRLAAPGVGILVHALENAEGCARVKGQIEGLGGRAIAVCGDLKNPGFGTELVTRAIDAFGRLDVLVANAGFPMRGGFGELSRSDLDFCFSTMPGAFFDMVKAALPFLRHKEGRVIAVSAHSAHMFRGNYPIFPLSAAAKGAMESLIRTLAVEIAPLGATANAVVPGLISKDASRDQFLSAEEKDALVAHIPMRRFGTAEEVAGVIEFLVSPAASYVTGQLIHVDGGLA
jgi:3-oxoacyl-[acyl-carrier protein] reductase